MFNIGDKVKRKDGKGYNTMIVSKVCDTYVLCEIVLEEVRASSYRSLELEGSGWSERGFQYFTKDELELVTEQI